MSSFLVSCASHLDSLHFMPVFKTKILFSVCIMLKLGPSSKVALSYTESIAK